MTPAQKRDMEIRGKRVGHAPDLLRSARARNYRRPPSPRHAHARRSSGLTVTLSFPTFFTTFHPSRPIFRKTNSMARSLT